jgi:hypothetical protein
VGVLSIALALTACAASQREVAQNLGNQYVGKNVDALVSKFGPPANTFRMNSGEVAYVWNLASGTDFSINRNTGSGSARNFACKVNVITSPAGIVTKLSTEDESGTGGIVGALGVDVYGSECAQHLGMPRTQM